MTPKPTPRAAVYCRISQDRTGAQAGVTRQEEDSRRLAAELGWEVVELHVDNDVSASKYSRRPRPGYEALVESMKAGRVTALVTWHPDRLYRRPRDLEDLVDVIDATAVQVATVRAGKVDLSTASGRLNARMLGAVATYESEIKSERVTRAAEQRASSGRFSGGMRPFGYEPDGMTVRESEAEHLRAAYSQVVAGVPLNEIVRGMHAAGALTSTGKAWQSQHLRSAMLSPRPAGLASYQGQVIGAAAWPALVPEDLWRTACAVLADPSRRTTRGPTPRHLLSGITVCGREGCGQQCRVSVTGGRDRVKRLRYRCPRGHVIRAKDALEVYVEARTLAYLETEGSVHAPEPGSSTAIAAAQAETLRGRLTELAEDYADGRISRDQLRSGTTRGTARLAELEAQLSASTRRAAVADLSGLRGPDLREAWQAMDLTQKRAALRELWTVTLVPQLTGRRGINDEGVVLTLRP